MSGLCEYKPGARIPESGAGSGSKDVQIQFQSGYKSDISFSPVFFSLLSQVLKTGQEIGFSEESLFRPIKKVSKFEI